MSQYLADADFRVQGGTGEVLLAQFTDDLGAYGGSDLDVELAGLIQATGGATATFRVRFGGTIDGVDGTTELTLTTAASEAQHDVSATVANPNAQTLIKLTGQISDAAQKAEIRGAVISIDRSGADSTAPVIQNVTPAPGLIPGDWATAVNTPIEFDVIDTAPGLRVVVTTLKYANDPKKYVVHDGSNFISPFNSPTSERTTISNGWHFKVLPTGGWLTDIEQMFTYAVDKAGNLEGSLP